MSLRQVGCFGINVIFVFGINWISSTCTAEQAAVPNAAGHYAASAEVVFGRRKRKGEGQGIDLKTVCSKESDPQALRLGLPQLCLDFSLNVNASDSCQMELDVGMRFRGDERKYFDLEPINPANLITCAAGEQLVSNAPIFQQICGSGVQVCVDFYNPQASNTLNLDKGSASGCPAITLHNCARNPSDPTLNPDIHLIPLDCFVLGNSCSQHSDCESCISSQGCGWCSAGYSNEHACKAKDFNNAPACDACGNAKCGCDWHYITCPITASVLLKANQTLADTLGALITTDDKYSDLKAKVATGLAIYPPNDPQEYHCVLTNQLKEEYSAHVTLTTLLSLAMLLVGSIVGVILGKGGYSVDVSSIFGSSLSRRSDQSEAPAPMLLNPDI